MNTTHISFISTGGRWPASWGLRKVSGTYHVTQERGTKHSKTIL